MAFHDAVNHRETEPGSVADLFGGEEGLEDQVLDAFIHPGAEELAQRVAESEKANVEIRDSRRAALNLMEDAVQARRFAETLNLALRSEIADRKQAQEDLRQRTAQFETLLNEAPLGVYLIDADFRIRGVNPSALQFFGNIAGLIGRHLDEVMRILWPKAYADQIVERFRHTLETGEPYMVPECIEERRDRGVTEYYEWQINRIPLPRGRYGVVCYFRDISARVLAAQRIRASEQRFRSLVAIITDVPWVADAQGAFIEPQPTWAKYTGQSWDEMRGFGWADALHPDDRENILAIWQRACESRTLYEANGRLRHAASGEYRYFEARATPLLNADGTVRQWVGTCTDVDERRRGKERLENTVAERTKALQQANAALLRDMEERKKLEVELLQAQKMESIGTLAGGIAHDFNNVLNIIQGYTSVFSKYAGEKNEMAESLEAINEAVQRGAGVVRQLLTLARKTEARLEPTNVNGLIAGLTKLLSETFPKTIEMTLDLIAEPPLLMADPNQINQVILNLCVNARDSMPQGGKLLLKTAVVSGVELPQSFDGGLQERYVRLRVSDTGTGMALSVKQRIFEPFFTTKEPGQGTGLGLSVAYGIVASHGGFLDVTSELGQGTTFDIYLPLAKNNLESIASQRQPDGDGRRPGAGATILFVDDEIRQLRRMQNFLESEGLKVLAASDGAEAVEVHLRHKNDIAVVVLDFRLPKLNGIEAFRTMRNTQPNLKALIATGFPTREVEAQLAGGEMADIITKPYQLAEVLEKISELLEADRPRQ